MENYSIIILKTVVVPGDWRSLATLERLPHEGYILCILETCGATSWLHASLSQSQPNIQSTTRTDNRPERPGRSSGGDLRWFARKTLLNSETEGTDNAAMGTSNALQSEQRGGFTGLKDLLPSEIH